MVKYFALMNVMRSTLLFSNQKMPLIMMNIHFFFFFYFLFFFFFFVSIRLYRSVKIELKVSFSDPFSRWKVEYKYMDK